MIKFSACSYQSQFRVYKWVHVEAVKTETVIKYQLESAFIQTGFISLELMVWSCLSGDTSRAALVITHDLQHFQVLTLPVSNFRRH